MAASALFDVPVWSAINATMLGQWVWPVDATEIVIFGDNDESYTGHVGAYTLARRAALAGVPVSVQFPQKVGWDFADVWSERKTPQQLTEMI
jgi:putative DNA primase/helicase